MANPSSSRNQVTLDGAEAAASIAHKLTEVIVIYPITPSTPLGESADAWSATNKKNVWGTVPQVTEMQSEAGAAGAIHGAIQTGALTTTFTASQGLLLMVPNMYKIAGELSSTVFHVTARSLAAQALSIFGDHQDIMAVRQCGWALMASSSVQEAQDLAAVCHAATLEARLPFLHFIDGFRTSHEINKITRLSDDDLRALISDDLIQAHRERALTPDKPVIRGTAQNPDVYFQAREACNPFYAACPGVVQKVMDRFAARVGRAYHLFDYDGAKDAERVVVIMGSGAETARETARALAAKGEKVGCLTVRLFRPFSDQHLLAALPVTVKSVAVLDRTKEPGANGEPLFQDVVTALSQATSAGTAPFKAMPRVVGGRYGLSSKEFTPAMVKAVFEELAKAKPKNHFMVGIEDDVGKNSLTYDTAYSIEPTDTVRCIFFGLGSDGTVGANKNSIKIIGEETENNAQGYFVYDSKKSGGFTISHLRFGPQPVRAPYLIEKAQFIACHNFTFLERLDVLVAADTGATFLLNSHYGPDEVWNHLPREVQQAIIGKKLKFYTIDATKVARDTGMGGRINTVMQTCFFAISGVLSRDAAIAKIKDSIKKTYGKRGEAVVQQNFQAVDSSLANLHEVKVPAAVTSTQTRQAPVSANAPEFVRKVLGPMMALQGDSLPISAMPVDGTFPTGTAAWEKRNIGLEMPVWENALCIQCGKCSFVCPHAVIRQKLVDPDLAAKAPAGFKTAKSTFKEIPGKLFTIQISPDDCTGCGLCVEVCPAKDKSQAGRKAINLAPIEPLAAEGRKHWDFFLTIPEADRTAFAPTTVKASQLLQPLFEFSGACAGCGETAYVKLLSQLVGDRCVIGNATGCSSIYSGNLPTTPYTKNAAGRGPAWSNSLFEDNAEFGLGMRLSIDKQKEQALELVTVLAPQLGDELAKAISGAAQANDGEVAAQRERVKQLKAKLAGSTDAKAKLLLSLADNLVRKSVWVIGGDGWAYDIGYGGLDHVLASGRNIKILVLDTEVYSNTGGQASKSTPRGAVAKFAAKGKDSAKKDLALMAMAYGSVYVAKVAMGANDAHTLKAFTEAEAYDGPAIIIAYAHCIAHGIDMRKGLDQQKAAVNCGHWQLFRYNPAAADGQSFLTIDSKDPTITFDQYAYNETRYRMLKQSDAPRADSLLIKARNDARVRSDLYRQIANLHAGMATEAASKPPASSPPVA
jgi:pyruvate-ferredoxin/flavodoxin oxidoreductase